LFRVTTVTLSPHCLLESGDRDRTHGRVSREVRRNSVFALVGYVELCRNAHLRISDRRHFRQPSGARFSAASVETGSRGKKAWPHRQRFIRFMERTGNSGDSGKRYYDFQCLFPTKALGDMTIAREHSDGEVGLLCERRGLLKSDTCESRQEAEAEEVPPLMKPRPKG